MRKSGILLGMLWVVLAALPVRGGESLTAEEFMSRARHSGSACTSGDLSGFMQHKRDGGAMERIPVSLQVRIFPEKVEADLTLSGRESYEIRLWRKDGKASLAVRSKDGGETGGIFRYGLDPADLAMGFLYYDWKKELESERVKGLLCRVMVLALPEKGKAVRAYILSDYYFPLKVEFFEDEQAAIEGEKILRTLEVGSFRKKNGLYYAELLKIRGGDWQSRVIFDKAEMTEILPSGAPLPEQKTVK